MTVKKKNGVLSSDGPLTALSGISDVRAAAFSSAGVVTLSDLCRYYPRTYEDRGGAIRVSDAAALAAEEDPRKVSLILTVSTRPATARLPGRKTVTKFSAVDETGSCAVTFFNQPYVGNSFAVGQTYRFYGKVSLYNRRVSLASPSFEPVPEPEEAPLPSLIPVYRCPEGLTQKKIVKSVSQALAICYPDHVEIPDPLPEEIRERYGLCSARFALFAIHRPESWKDLEIARKRLSFEELFRFALSLRFQQNRQRSGTPLPIPGTDLSPFLSVQPFALTGAQERVLQDIQHAPSSPDHPMNRILIGDVGSGKTVCAAAAMYCVVKHGLQAVLMAPTEILARQHYLDLRPMFEALGISCGLLVGSLPAQEKKVRKAELRDGSLKVIIGTHALLEDDVVFSDPGLVVIDEQHRFGVEQRERIREKSRRSHLLMMSATPIPRTLALTLFGNQEVSFLDELPPGRQLVSTYRVNESYRERLNAFTRKQVDEGHQVYIVCPAIDESDTSEEDGPTWKAAVAYADVLAHKVFPDVPVAFLHGKMKGTERAEIMERFVSGEIRILVSTTVIEVGVNIPNATLMIVENAERFGLSQLHQLRGRVGRGAAKSYCVLVSDSSAQTALERLDTLCQNHDGFAIAEKDLELRGPGDFVASFTGDGIRQAGDLHFIFASGLGESELLTSAFQSVESVLRDDPTLEEETHSGIRSMLFQPASS